MLANRPGHPGEDRLLRDLEACSLHVGCTWKNYLCLFQKFRKRSYSSQLIFSISLSAGHGVRPTFPCDVSAGV